MLTELATLTTAHLFDGHSSMSMGFGRSGPRFFSVNQQTHTLLKEYISVPLRTAFLTNLEQCLDLTNTRIDLMTSQIEKLQAALHSVTQWKEDAKELAATIEGIQAKSSESIPDLPNDIIWNILRAAAEESKTTASMLSLVSKEVQRWVDPLLFRHICFVNDETTNTLLPEAIHESSRLSQVAQYMTGVHLVRRYGMAMSYTSVSIIHVLSQLPSFRALSLEQALLDSQLGFETWNVEIPRLRHLLWKAGPTNSTLRVPVRLFSSLSHITLHFPARNPEHFDWKALNELETLPVLAIDVMKSGALGPIIPPLHGKDNIRAGIRRIQAITERLTSRALHTVLWREWFSADEVDEFQDCVETVTDLRLIICVARLPPPARLVNGGLWPFLELNSLDKFWSLGIKDQVKKLRMTR